MFKELPTKVNNFPTLAAVATPDAMGIDAVVVCDRGPTVIDRWVVWSVAWRNQWVAHNGRYCRTYNEALQEYVRRAELPTHTTE
jgi:hypothetical protein